MRAVLLGSLGMILGFFFGELLAATFGMIGFAVFDSALSGPLLWILRSLPIVCALAGAVAAVAVANRRRAG
jgi:uncharacterized membrane protein